MKPGNLTVVEYAAKFKELVKSCPQYNSAATEGSKCVKFESGLYTEIKRDIRYPEICQFSMLVISAYYMMRIENPDLFSVRVLVRRKGMLIIVGNLM